MDDPDAPSGTWVHWVAFNISSNTRFIPAGADPGGMFGRGTDGSLSYKGPCPPDGRHRYFFKLYALDETIELPEGASKSEVERAMHGHIIESVTLMGRYARG
jgi:Raf kinase inhibitor-like YbhB/YbcL family protein